MPDPRFMKEDEDILVRLEKKCVYLEAKLDSAEKALAIANDNFKIYVNNVDKRLDNGNHFKDLHVAQSGTFITRTEFERVNALTNKIVGIGLSISIVVPIVLAVLNLVKR